MRQIALFSAWEKEGIASIARALESMGMECVATGNTRTILESAGLKVTDISDLTGEPERFGGRVKTLHHKVFGGILFRPGQDEKEWPENFRVAAVVCNFYPFIEKASGCKTIDEMIEWVDIGGPSMVRAAAKNHKHVWVFTRKEQYVRFITQPGVQEDPKVAEQLRSRFALEAFEQVAELDEAIARQFKWKFLGEHIGGGNLTYGENPQQPAYFVANKHNGVRLIGGLSYNNLRDAEGAFRFVSAFAGPAVSVIKHQTLCGAAAGKRDANPDDVFHWAWEGDTVSRFGGILGFNFVPQSEQILEILRKKFIEVVVMPRDERSTALAEELHAQKNKLRFVLVDPYVYEGALALHHPDRIKDVSPDSLSKVCGGEEIIQGFLGRLVQKADAIEYDPAAEPLDPRASFLRFGQWAAACSKSNAMVLAGTDEKAGVNYLAGGGQGQPNRLDTLRRLALPRAQEFSARLGVPMGQLTCFSDAFLSHADSLGFLQEAGVRRLIQPGGSKSDDVVADAAREKGIEMEILGKRHFWH
jgi:phosphoribosylaminoimidazolecarboxamide formyltransferase/IMP cyclohydrolase